MKEQPVLKAIVKIAYYFAKLGAGSASSFSRYQPNLPTQLRFLQ